MNKSDDYTIVEVRPLWAQEKALIEWLIEHGSPEACEFAAQVEHAQVVGHCSCGCPTIDLGIDGSRQRTVGVSQVLAYFTGQTPEGLRVGVALHAREGKLSELEVYSFGDHDKAFSLPMIGSLAHDE